MWFKWVVHCAVASCFWALTAMPAFSSELIAPQSLQLQIVDVKHPEQVPCIRRSGQLGVFSVEKKGLITTVAKLKGYVQKPGELILSLAGLAAIYTDPASGTERVKYPVAVCVSQSETKGLLRTFEFHKSELGDQHSTFWRHSVKTGPIFVRLVFALPEGVDTFYVTYPAFAKGIGRIKAR